MKKEETISLSFVLGFVLSVTIALLLDNGGGRNAFVILAVILLLLAMGPFKAEGQKPNRVEKLVIIIFFSAFAGLIAFTFLYLGITDFHKGGWTYLVLFSVMVTAASYFAYVCSPPTREGKGEMKAFKIVSLEECEKLFSNVEVANGPCSSDEFIDEVLENTNDDETNWDDENDRGRYIEERIEEMIDEMNEKLDQQSE